MLLYQHKNNTAFNMIFNTKSKIRGEYMHKLIIDSYIWSDKLRILTEKELNIHGLEMFGHDMRKNGFFPLDTHIHKSMEFVYVVSGSQVYCTDDQKYTVMGNQVFITDAFSEHDTGNIAHGRYEIYWFRLKMPTNRNFLNLSKKSGELLQNQLLKLPHHVITPQRNLRTLIAGSFECMSINTELSRTQGCAMLVEFLCEILNNHIHQWTLSDEISAVLSYIEVHICENISLEELAVVSALSLSRLKARFRQEVQISPREYINRKKVERSKILLTTTNFSITEIAFSLSFSSSDYFAVIFRKFVGCTPTAYRIQNQTGEV